jgi:1-deoxy-D-xylulose-5-phosphate synthase
MSGSDLTIKGDLPERVDSPEDLKDLSIESLEILAYDIRQLIIDTVSRRGGHLASSLGAVELTLALLKVFNPPRDKIVFDVGHQAYAYKILTGRRECFADLRTKGGVAGFPKRSESECDFFDVGHAGNAISAAAGMAHARCLAGRSHKVIALVGDGSLTCGVSYEALNQAGAAKKDMIIILNDNEMSISPNVGAMAAYLSRIMTGQLVTRFRREIKNILNNMPGAMGKSMYGLAKQFEEALKGFITPGRLFEDLGFKYVGPVDGHNLKHMIETLSNVKRFSEPVLIHAVTCKGKGYCEAEENPSKYHGIGPFDAATGMVEKTAQGPTYTDVFGETLTSLAEDDHRIVAISAAMEHGTGLADFAEKFPDRFMDVGIAEQHAVVFASGLTSEGLKPVVAIYSTFLQRSYDHIIHDVCMQGTPVILAADRAGIVGEDGPTHHGVFDIAYMRSVPGLTMMAPATGDELRDMLVTSVDLDGPSAIRYPRSKIWGELSDRPPQPIPIGKGRLVRRGSDMVIIGLGSMLQVALEAAEELEKEGLSIAVINPRFIKPMDSELIIGEAHKSGRVLVVEEGVLAGGFGSAVLEMLSEQGVRGIEVHRMGIPDQFVEHGTRQELLDELGLCKEGVAAKIRSILADKKETPEELISFSSGDKIARLR